MANYMETNVFNQNDEFYPTPLPLLDMMFTKMVKHCRNKGLRDFEYQRFSVLEPSAGKGDILNYYKNKIADSYSTPVDAIETDNFLRQTLKGNDNCYLIWDNFLTFRTEKHYDLIAMNPPFSKGAKHLMRAIELAESNGGDTIIMCLLNAETLLLSE